MTDEATAGTEDSSVDLVIAGAWAAGVVALLAVRSLVRYRCRASQHGGASLSRVPHDEYGFDLEQPDTADEPEPKRSCKKARARAKQKCGSEGGTISTKGKGKPKSTGNKARPRAAS